MSAIATMLTDWAAAKTRERRSTGSNPSEWFVDWVSGGRPVSSGAKVNHSTALKYTPFWSAVKIISGTLAALPFKVYTHLEPRGKALKPAHRAYRLVHDEPNAYMSALKFIESRQIGVLCYGNGYAEIQRDGAGRPVALWPLLPDKTERKLHKDGTPYYQVRVTLPAGGEETVELPDYNVLHIMGLTRDGFTGVDVVTYHKEAIGYGIAVKEYGSRFFGQGCNPGGYLEHPQTLSPKAKDYLKASIEKSHQGLSNAHRLMVLEEGMKWHELGVDPKKAQALEVQKWTVDDCARIFQVPPHMLGSMEFSKYNNVEQLRLEFYNGMLYWFRTWEQEINRKLFMPSEQGRLFCEILVDAMLRSDNESRAKFYTAGRQGGWFSINDVREKENMNPIGPEGDVYLDPLNMVPAGSLTANLSEGDDPGPGRSMNGAQQALRRLLVTQWRRVIIKQANANGQKASPAWWENHRQWARGVLLDTAVACGAVGGVDPERTEATLRSYVDTTLKAGSELRGSHAEWLADDLMDEIDEIGGTDS